jgi:hypothetical protein
MYDEGDGVCVHVLRTAGVGGGGERGVVGVSD